MLANGTPFDPSTLVSPIATGKDPIFHLGDSAAVHDMKMKVLECKPMGDDGPLFAIYWVDWRDGFGPSHSKNNRKSIVIWTITICPPPNLASSSYNTFPIAIGLKSSKHWRSVEHRFQRDVKACSDAQNPISVYEGFTKKMINVYFERIVSLADKPERAEITYTQGHGSDFHQWFGKAFRLQTPITDSNKVATRIQQQKDGKCDNKIQFGWSDEFIKSDSSNGGRFFSCKDCRLNRVVALCHNQKDIFGKGTTCSDCANFRLDVDTSKLLELPVGDDYPKKESDNDCPVPPPKGREAGLKVLSHIDVTFDFLKQATKFAFFHLTKPGPAKKRWTKKTLSYYLWSCAVSGGIIDELWELWKGTNGIWEKRKRKEDITIDWNDSKCFYEFEYPASWVGSLSLHKYIELVMHLLFHGAAEANMDLTNLWLKQWSWETKWRREQNELLTFLRSFQLSWLPVLPFKGENLSTGSWVSENWLALIRIQKVCYAWTASGKQLEMDRRGMQDVQRFIVPFTALVARVMTHGGVDDRLVDEVDCYAKEFLSSLRELDTQIRHKKMKKPFGMEIYKSPGYRLPAYFKKEKPIEQEQPTKNNGQSKKGNAKKGNPKTKNNNTSNGKPKKGNAKKGNPKTKNNNTSNGKPKKGNAKKGDPKTKTKKPAPTQEELAKRKRIQQEKAKLREHKGYWARSNYMSILNLPAAMKYYGPYVELYDGGPKGEKYIQEVKPNVQKNLQEGVGRFFQSMQEKLYKLKVINCFESSLGLQITDKESYFDEVGTVVGEQPMDWVDCCLDENGNFLTEKALDSIEIIALGQSEKEYSQVEDTNMSKANTIFVYKNLQSLQSAISHEQPVSGVLVSQKDENGGAPLQLYFVYKKPSRSFGWMKATFNDDAGIHKCGLWYAPFDTQDFSDGPPQQDLDSIKQLTKMSVVLIPFKYAIKNWDDADDSFVPFYNCYCAITNYWKERNKHGKYVLPGLDYELYGIVDDDDTTINNNCI